MEKVRVYVAGSEGNSNFGTSFWDWYPQESYAKNRINELTLDKQLNTNGIIYSGSLLVDNSDDKEDITIQVENFLEQNNWENSFN